MISRGRQGPDFQKWRTKEDLISAVKFDLDKFSVSST